MNEEVLYRIKRQHQQKQSNCSFDIYSMRKEVVQYMLSMGTKLFTCLQYSMITNGFFYFMSIIHTGLQGKNRISIKENIMSLVVSYIDFEGFISTCAKYKHKR